jgi:hypothetical protein
MQDPAGAGQECFFSFDAGGSPVCLFKRVSMFLYGGETLLGQRLLKAPMQVGTGLYAPGSFFWDRHVQKFMIKEACAFFSIGMFVARKGSWWLRHVCCMDRLVIFLSQARPEMPDENGLYRPVLKHGPMSLTCVQVLW